MYLKNLELEGFKSFVDSTNLEFRNGFTAIVGPNGCGKSNVSDAIRWVIGEQRSKTLRSTRITDLIFNGSSSRKPVNRAEISLTLSSVPTGIRIAGVPNVAEDVKVTRCYHRSGESEFYINQIPCRLKDITDFLMDAGISPKVLTIIEQGHIQDIITSKPEERRILIEEAAGILKFKHRKNEAIRKLDSSRQNLERVADIVQELARQVESLKRQAAKAERYKKYKTEIKELSLSLFSVKVRRYQSQLEVIEAEFEQQTEKKTEWNARHATFENQIAQLNVEIEESLGRLNEARETIHQLKSQIGSSEQSIAFKKEQKSEAEADIESATGEISQMTGDIGGLTTQIESERQNLSATLQEINEQEIVLDQRKAENEQKREALQKIQEQVLNGERSVHSLFQQTAQSKNQMTALETRIQGLETGQRKLVTEKEENRSQAQENQSGLEQREAEHQQKTEELARLKEQQEALRQETTLCSQQLQVEIDSHSSQKEDYFHKASLLGSLEKLRNQFEGFHDGVKSLMNNQNGERIPGLREVLVDVLQTPAEYEVAIETALGEKLQSVIVNSHSDSMEAIGYLKNHHSGRGLFAPLNPKPIPFEPLNMNGTQGIVGTALNFIECPEEYRPVIDLLLKSVVIVQDMDVALHLHQKPDFYGTVVTLNGEMIDANGFVTGGSLEHDSSGLLARNREIETLTSSVSNVKKVLDASQGNIERKKQGLSQLEANLRQLDQQTHATEIATNNKLHDLEQSRKEAERLENRHTTIEGEITAIDVEREKWVAEKSSLDQQLESVEQKRVAEEELLIGHREELEQSRSGLEEISSEISRLKVLIASLIGRRENTLTEIKRLELQQQNLKQQIVRRESDLVSNQNKITEIGGEISMLEDTVLKLSREKDQLTETAVQEEESLRQKEDALKGMEQDTRELSRKIQEIIETLSQIEIKRSENRLQIVHLEERAYEDFNATREELKSAYDENINESETDELVKELKEKVAKLGEVNLAALSDFEKTNERYTFLKRQQDDLAESIELLHSTIEKINHTTKQRFLDTFKLVSENFKEIFARLFQGGKASLTLVDESNPLDSGIEITANPFGKSLQSLALMSGGEKAMTAIALMFAVFKVRPSPFCLLDEVDAPLDEANVVRFQEMLKEMAVNTQFIIITHNQKTMSFANALYGITMEEQGVSKAVSVHFN
ncbi:MAG: chromosome segregation protein SMC [Nitrospinae bacterium]|nr:chromosome segregation protein SMC [Nitrospinota bacterium]MBL7019489.1 chromosome segregation protein SMC [Nitrospinaceae bacterium]